MTNIHFLVDKVGITWYINNDTMSFIRGGYILPKVTDEYLAEKKEYILECTAEILREKPLYLITMRDIIKQAGFSQGAIYRYYGNIDEIYIDYINKHTTKTSLEERIDSLLSLKQTEKEILTECFVAMGEYIEELLRSGTGKTFFELLILYSPDQEKSMNVFPRLKFKQSLEYAQMKILTYTMDNIAKGIFIPQIPLESLILFVRAFIDGIAQTVIFDPNADKGQDPQNVIDVPAMFRTLAKAVIAFLEE